MCTKKSAVDYRPSGIAAFRNGIVAGVDYKWPQVRVVVTDEDGNTVHDVTRRITHPVPRNIDREIRDFVGSLGYVEPRWRA
jgi:hypothetical protein